ncbi:excinuclease ABC subunit C [Bacilli bacterium PM5-3]|nr:excinuclease ABC subunit C [Bacilli bacterium PM5-3]MDH6603107.1 excinuclease ABC subunit C [Bacilli bacterium PM5-9]
MDDKIKQHINTLLTTLPHKPGCYLMKNKRNNIIYVGKAKDLKKRVTSYFNKVHNDKTQLLVNEVVDIEHILTSNEKESLILEINLIKKHRPKYNVMFMDDKFYPYIAITKEKNPRLKVVRNTKNKKMTYFGPYPNSNAAWDTLNLLNKLYKLRKCDKLPKKECLYYHLEQCVAPCIVDVSDEEYANIIKKIKHFLNGNTSDVIKEIENKMNAASEKLNFEKALDYKNLIDSINTTTNKQKVFKYDLKDRDYIGVSYNKDYISIQILIVRNGTLIERNGDIFTLIDDVQDTLESFLLQYYDLNSLPSEVLIEQKYCSEVIEELLDNKLKVPQKGDHKKMLDLACENAQNLLKQEYEMVTNNDNKLIDALNQLQNILQMSDKIHRIEAFDNSTLQGSNSIGSMVVFEDGKPIKSEYRKFRIKETEIVDDYAFMREVLYRRYYRVLVDKLKQPDLIIVDGGIGQVNIAREIISTFNLNIKVIGLVKDDKHRTSHILDDNLIEHKIDKQSELFFLLTRIQDEVHRYAITYHRKLRSKSMFSSVLDDVNGIGEVRKKKLLKHFESFKKMKEASLDEIKEVLPEEIASDLFNKLQEENDN